MAKKAKLYCVRCGTEMTGKFCPNDGWSLSASTPAPDEKPSGNRSIRQGNVSGPSVNTTGDNSTIFWGSNAEITPATHRVKERSVLRLIWIRIVAFLGIIGSIASITGLNLGSFHFDGLITIYRSLFGSSLTGMAPQNAIYAVITALVFMLCLLAAVSCFAFLAQLKGQKYVWLLGSYVENRQGSLTRTKLSGVCPRCGGEIRPVRVVVDTKIVKSEGQDGKMHEKEKAVKAVRLVCRNNAVDHRFKLDPTEIKE